MVKKILSKYFEIIILVFTILFLLTKQNMPRYGERISMLFFGCLSFYYLASAVLVFLDKKRVGRMMRLIYLFGLWAVSFTVIAVMARTLLLQMDIELLVVAVSSCCGTLLFCWLYYRRLEEKDKPIFKDQVQPLAIRSLISICIAALFLSTGNYAVYHMFGTHKNDPVYAEKIVRAYENPGDTAVVNDFKRYDALINADSTSEKEIQLNQLP